MKFLLPSKGYKLGEEHGSPIKLALSPNTADRVTGGFPEECCGPCQYKWGEAGLKGLQTTP